MEGDEKLKRVRKDIINIEQNIHLNNAGASPMPSPVVKSVKAVLDLESEKGVHSIKTKTYLFPHF
jgi:hypothetical protein